MYRYIILALTVLAGSASADVFSISASERGWVCNGPSFGCPNNNGADPSNNYSAGHGSITLGSLRDWFEFAIPDLNGASLVSATLSLADPAHSGGDFTFTVYGLSNEPIVFTDVTTSNPFGSVATSSASTGTTVTITLNTAALAALSADQTSNIFIGGVDSAESGSSLAGDFFSTTGSSFATTLTLTTTAGTTAVPEPGSLLLLASVVLLVCAFRAVPISFPR
jgi:hypothetical protein